MPAHYTRDEMAERSAIARYKENKSQLVSRHIINRNFYRKKKLKTSRPKTKQY
ncbi:MAG: hypothetical protein OXD54_07220 [Candidatus Poribacteria bacterium]|nr:hypothetical protein [Candidatus Poribacteria bacterium]